MTQRSARMIEAPISHRARLIAPATFAAALLLRRVSSAGAQATPTAESLLESAVTAMAALESFAFKLTTLEGETQFIEGITLNDVSGAVQRPNSFTATAEIELIIASLKFTIISTDGRLWFTDPFGDGETYQEISLSEFGNFDPTLVINPDRLLLPALSAISAPILVGEEELEDGVRANRIDGIVNLASVTGLAGTPEASELGFSFPEEVPFSVWVDAESLVRRMDVTGPILPDEAENIVRRVDFSAFNELVDIQPPA
jgi:hypothetical protein